MWGWLRAEMPEVSSYSWCLQSSQLTDWEWLQGSTWNVWRALGMLEEHLEWNKWNSNTSPSGRVTFVRKAVDFRCLNLAVSIRLQNEIMWSHDYFVGDCFHCHTKRMNYRLRMNFQGQSTSQRLVKGSWKVCERATGLSPLGKLVSGYVCPQLMFPWVVTCPQHW